MDKLEEIRNALKKRYLIGTIITIVVIIIILFMSKNYMFCMMAISVVALLGIFVTVICTSKLKSEYKRVFKNTFVQKALERKFTDLVYMPSSGISYETIASTQMMHMGDRFYSEDYISAKYKDIKFEQSDVHIEEEYRTTDSDGNTSTTYETIFKGRWMVFDFNKIFKANVQIVQKGFGNSKVKRFFGNKEELYKKVEMESESFNKKFNVFAQNEHDAFYIITPSLMEKIEKLDEQNKGKLLFCFVNNCLHIGIYNNEDSFEPGGVFKKLNEEEIITKISGDIEMITQFVDELNMDNDLFKKEV